LKYGKERAKRFWKQFRNSSASASVFVFYLRDEWEVFDTNLWGKYIYNV